MNGRNEVQGGFARIDAHGAVSLAPAGDFAPVAPIALTAGRKAEFDRLMEEDEANRLRSACNARLAAALRAGSAADAALPPWLSKSQEIAWNLQEGLIDPPELGLEISDEDRAFARSAEGEYLKLVLERTGETMPEDELKEKRQASAKLLNMSFEIADRMKSAGFNACRETPFRLFRYFIHSRHVELMPGFRRLTFIPCVAQALRAPMVAALESFLERHPFARMWTMTSGAPVLLGNIRERAKWMHGRISDLNAQQFMKDLGVEIVFRSTELGTPEFDQLGNVVGGGEIETDENGQLYFHVHAHLVVIQRFGYIPPAKWKGLLKRVQSFWTGPDGKQLWWCEGGEDEDGNRTSARIVNPREVCKYVTKPAEMLKLDGAQLVALQEQLTRLKLVQPMGRLAAEIKAREEKNLRLARRRTEDGPVYVEVPNWNRHSRRTRDEKNQDRAEKLNAKDNGADKLRVVARSMPCFGPCGVAEPTVVVMATRWNEAGVRINPLVARLIAATAAKFGVGLGKAIRVHTCTPTVLEPAAFPFVADLPPNRKPLTGAELAGYSR